MTNPRCFALLFALLICTFLCAAPPSFKSDLTPPSEKEQLKVYTLSEKAYHGDVGAAAELDTMIKAAQLPKTYQNPFLLEEKANAGDAKAMYDLGTCFNNALSGLGKNPDKGAAWIKKSADAGYPAAMSRYGLLNLHTKFKDSSTTASEEYIKKAADAGDPAGLMAMGQIYLDRGDLPHAEALFKQLIKAKDAHGAFGMALLEAQRASPGNYDRINFDNPNPASLAYLEQAHEMGFERATATLAKTYYELYINSPGKSPADLKKAVDYQVMAASRGDAGAARRLAGWYESGEFIPADRNKALEYYTIAADQRSPVATKWLIRYYGIAGDKANAEKWTKFSESLEAERDGENNEVKNKKREKRDAAREAERTAFREEERARKRAEMAVAAGAPAPDQQRPINDPTLTPATQAKQKNQRATDPEKIPSP